MSTETTNLSDPLEYVRQRMKPMPVSEQTQIALTVNITHRTVYNILVGKRDAKYSTVMKLHKALKDAEAAAAVEGAAQV